ncbi:MAG: hypothetical protein ISR65_15860 [Bacteriovoracaceae bacterium]|nr:hypothetical protein [Bacteriovoracaceae bacterium]
MKITACISLVLLTLVLSKHSFAGQDETAIARALADRLEDELQFEDEGPNEHPQTERRRFEDKNPMWLMLYVRPRQNQNFPNFHAKGFRVGLINKPYSSVRDIENINTFNMKKISPWSMKYTGIGRIYFYRQMHYKKLFKVVQSSDDYPKVETFKSSNNARNCTCSRSNRRECEVRTCGASELIGSIKFDPGVAFYSRENFRGSATLITPLAFSRRPLTPGGEVCISLGSSQAKKARSFHFDALIKQVHLYKRDNCRGARSWYSWQRQTGVVRKVSNFVRGQISSVKLVYKRAYDLL